MSTEIKVPTLGESITSGIIAAWHVKEGDFVKKDQVIYELETDKITSEGLAEVSGVISLIAEEGDEVDIGQTVAKIDESTPAPEKEGAPADPEPALVVDDLEQTPEAKTPVQVYEKPRSQPETVAKPKPAAPKVGLSQSSSINFISFSSGSILISLRLFKYNSCELVGLGFIIT